MKDTADAVAELGERFPDMSDAAVMLWISEYENATEINPASPVGRTMLFAYEHGVKAAKAYSEAMFGIDLAR
jgi:hypothetical protein